MNKDANEIFYELCLYNNKPVLFTPYRLKKDNLKDNIYLYEIRHDINTGKIISLEHFVAINFKGTIISNIPLIKDNNSLCSLKDDDLINYDNHQFITLNQYQDMTYINKVLNL